MGNCNFQAAALETEPAEHITGTHMLYIQY